ncbi:MAG: alpha-amylase [Gammaproteobacteria bacterium]|nr:alpha-amylase [Gammaproteobacteria bacterium]
MMHVSINYKNHLSKVLLSVYLMLLAACDQAPETAIGAASDKPTEASGISSATVPYQQRRIEDEVFYFLLPDRFENGDPSNDQGDPNTPISHGGFNPTSPGHYHGGDLSGLIKRLDYLQDMGVTAIWLTPILRNQALQGDSSGYHGYWPIDFTEIDPHLGRNEDLKALINAAHQRNMKVFFDIITNHTADVIKYRECHLPDTPLFSTETQLCEYRDRISTQNGQGYTPYLIAGTEQLKRPSWLNDPKFYHNQGDSTWTGENSIYGDFMGLDDIDTDNPEVVAGMIEIFANLIREFRPDGFRVDTVKHVNLEFWQVFTPAIMAAAKENGIENFFIFGEVYSGDPKELSLYTTAGKMPSVLDFALQYAIKDVLIYEQGTDKLTQLFAEDHRYNDSDSHANWLMNFVSNHDVGRFAFTLEQALPEISETERLRRIQLAHALMFFLRGVPVIYYGDEQGFVGYGGDRGAREDMMPSLTNAYNSIDLLGTDKSTADNNFDSAHPLYLTMQSLAKVYQQQPSLRYGEQTILQDSAQPGILIVRRETSQEQTLMILNSAKTPQTIAKDVISSAPAVIYSIGEWQRQSDEHWLIAPLSLVIIKQKVL